MSLLVGTRDASRLDVDDPAPSGSRRNVTGKGKSLKIDSRPKFRPVFDQNSQFLPDAFAISDLRLRGDDGNRDAFHRSDSMKPLVALPRLSIMSKFYILHSAEQLHERIHLTLSRDPYVGGRAVQFELIDNSGILLKGSVRSYFQKQMAQESLRQIEGLGRIVNQLEVVRS
jgi:hypothetical protein